MTNQDPNQNPSIPTTPEVTDPQSTEEALGNAALSGLEEGTLPTELRDKDSGSPTTEQVVELAGTAGMDASSVSRVSDEALSDVDTRSEPTDAEVLGARKHAAEIAHLDIEDKIRLGEEVRRERYGDPTRTDR